MKAIGQQIADVRATRGLSLGAVEKAVIEAGLRDEDGEPITLTGAALSRIEAGERMPGLRTLVALSRVLRVQFIIDKRGASVRMEGKA
jgi:transcriptional regulator with XRE-family HTH domain